MKQSEIAREQFNKRAGAFRDWAVTKNLEYSKSISEFIDLSPEDCLLDVACGTGDFALFVSPYQNISAMQFWVTKTKKE